MRPDQGVMIYDILKLELILPKKNSYTTILSTITSSLQQPSQYFIGLGLHSVFPPLIQGGKEVLELSEAGGWKILKCRGGTFLGIRQGRTHNSDAK